MKKWKINKEMNINTDMEDQYQNGRSISKWMINKDKEDQYRNGRSIKTEKIYKDMGHQ